MTFTEVTPPRPVYDLQPYLTEHRPPALRSREFDMHACSNVIRSRENIPLGKTETKCLLTLTEWTTLTLKLILDQI